MAKIEDLPHDLWLSSQMPLSANDRGNLRQASSTMNDKLLPSREKDRRECYFQQQVLKKLKNSELKAGPKRMDSESGRLYNLRFFAYNKGAAEQLKAPGFLSFYTRSDKAREGFYDALDSLKNGFELDND